MAAAAMLATSALAASGPAARAAAPSAKRDTSPSATRRLETAGRELGTRVWVDTTNNAIIMLSASETW